MGFSSFIYIIIVAYKYFMLIQTNYKTDPILFQEVCQQLPEVGMKTTINQPTGNFFYDPWILKEEYKGTVWETLYNSLPVIKGEARIIILDPARCYQIHADIDDRYHLNILGEECYLIDLVRDQMFRLVNDGIWYEMDASFLHTATNFGRQARVQLVVRKLLLKNKLKDPVKVRITAPELSTDDRRFLFDNSLSMILNGYNKTGIITDFDPSSDIIQFSIESSHLDSLQSMMLEKMILEKI